MLEPAVNESTVPALELREVVKRYASDSESKGTLAVKGISFQVRPGELLCLLGPNGAGKTTTIEMCEGFLKPTSGSISVFGLNPVREPDKVRARIGIMLQGGGSYSGIRVREMLELSAKYSANPLDVDWLIETLGLQGVAGRTYRRLSGGQQQRLSLAMAIIARPQLVFLDEPTAGMDAQSRLLVWELIRALKRDGVSVVLTTHLMDEAEALADHVVIMNQGEIVAEGTPTELMQSQANPRIYLATDQDVDVEGFAAAGLHVQAQKPLHYMVEGQATPGLIAKVAQELDRQGVLARRLESSQLTLEDVFLQLTGSHLRS